MARFHERYEVIDTVLDLLQKNKLNNKQKEFIYNIVMEIQYITALNKERFNMYYKLGQYQEEQYDLVQIADLYNCKVSTIKNDISYITRSLYHLSDDDMQKVKDIILEYYKSIGISYIAFSYEEKRNIISGLLEIAKQNLLNKEQKEKICGILDIIENKSEIQNRRFKLFYNLNDDEKQYRQCDIARLENRSPEAIVTSIRSVTNKLVHVKYEKMYLLKTILDECKNQK